MTFIVLILIGTQSLLAQGMPQGKNMTEQATRKYEIFLDDHDGNDGQEKVEALNDKIGEQKQHERALGAILIATFAPNLITKTATATTNVLNLLVESMKGEQKDWLQASQQQCRFSYPLKQESKKDDFYCLPSTKGALDPENIKFKGFGCRNYLECVNKNNRGREVFRVYCSLRTDSTGVAEIVNHSKFLVEIDTLMFDPFYCSLPYDSVTKDRSMTFDFNKRKDLAFNLNVKIYSSWINEAIMITKDQLLGEFNITANISKDKLNADSIFVYSKNNNPEMLNDGTVSLSGDCFLVPRSYTGTPDGTTAARAWGTGEYRVEMTVTETCQMVNDYYYKKDGATAQQGNWDKDVWQSEWNDIKDARKTTSLTRNIGRTIVSTYKGSSGWCEIFAEPAITVISTNVTTDLNGFLGLESTTATGSADAAAAEMMMMQ